jgi:hypothetical protein
MVAQWENCPGVALRLMIALIRLGPVCCMRGCSLPYVGACLLTGWPVCLAGLCRQEGVRALWKGNGVTIIHRLPYSSVNFWTYEQVSSK